MAALTTVFEPSSWCANRFAVYVDDNAPGTSIIPPSSGWVDPSFTKCIPTQYTTAYPTFSPGVCPAHMDIVKHGVETKDGKTVYTAACCQSGFAPMSVDSGYLCTSAITSPMAFLLDPNISTADVYTTLPPELWIEHDQMTVQWESTDLDVLPTGVASQYKMMMGVTAAPQTTDHVVAEKTAPGSPSVSITTTKPKPTTSIAWITPGYSHPDSISANESHPTTLSTSASNAAKAKLDVWVSAFFIISFGLGLSLLG
ncbi:hypothetical protein F4802DRAFT_564002 [Xylaria palmicola]|nr:hypothetical protein F4802DRAFT_564002 [Xylaria palmicola]